MNQFGKPPKPLYTKPNAGQIAPGPIAQQKEPKPFANPFGQAEGNPLAAIQHNSLINGDPQMHLVPHMPNESVAPMTHVRNLDAINSRNYRFNKLRSMLKVK